MTTSESRIESIDVRAIALPMENPHQTASGTITESPLILIDITTDSGITGHGLLFTYTTMALKPVAEFVKNLEPLLRGTTLAPVTQSHELQTKFRLLGTQGLVGMALAGIDMALWDTLARTMKAPLVQLLGGEPRSIPAYGAVGYDGVDGSAKVAAKWAQQGLKGIKAKIGYPTVDEDIQVIHAMRDVTGPDMEIMVDYNQCLSPSEAITRCQLLDQEGITWIEEPTLAHDYQGHAKVSTKSDTPIQCGENWWGPLDLQHAIDYSASDYVMLDVMKIGGVTGWMEGASICELNGLHVSSHLWPELSARLLCCTPTANWLEYCDWWNPILKSPLELDNGYAVIDNSIGSGIEWNENVIKRHIV